MKKQISSLTVKDILEVKSAIESYIINELKYTDDFTVNFSFEKDSFRISIDAIDKFMRKLEYNERYSLSLWEVSKIDEDFQSLLDDVWTKLQKHQPRSARELRYSLICLSKVTESSLDIETEVAKAVFADIKMMKGKLSEMLLEYNPEKNDVGGQ